MHFDAQPVTPAEWKSDPWKPVLKARDAAGQWQEMASERLQGKIDPEWRLFARASADDKGPIMMFLAAIDGCAAQQQPAVNIKVLLDSQEEKGSPRLHVVLQENEALLKSDGLIVYDGAMPSSNRVWRQFRQPRLDPASISPFLAPTRRRTAEPMAT